VKAAIDEAIRCREENRPEVIVFNFSGHGFLDLAAYDAFLAGKLEDVEFPEAELQRSLAELPKVPQAD